MACESFFGPAVSLMLSFYTAASKLADGESGGKPHALQRISRLADVLSWCAVIKLPLGFEVWCQRLLEEAGANQFYWDGAEF